MRSPRVGVLALQGDFARHLASLESLGADTRRVIRPDDLEGLDALVLPGGESTTMLRLVETQGLREALERFVREKAVLGTCAGVILLGSESAPLPAAPFGALDVSVERNGYGRQIDSFSAEVDAKVVGGSFPGVFIRAPRIRRVGPDVEVVAWRRQGSEAAEPVGVRRGKVVGLTFHPELTSDLRFHRWFLAEVAGMNAPEARASGAGAPAVRGRS